MKRQKKSSSSERSGLLPDEIADLGVVIADREGLAAVSMRRLARELDVTPMALYWHFDNKDQLIDAMAERVVAAAEFPVHPRAKWERRLRAVLESLVELLREHPWMGRVAIERVVPLPRYLTALETMLGAIRQAGLNASTATMLVQHAVQAVVSMVENEPASKQAEEAAPTEECLARYEFLSGLPESEYPNIRVAATPMTMADPKDYYAAGVAMIVGGIRTIAARGLR